MPRVNPLTRDQKIQDNLRRMSDKCVAECALMGITYTEIAELLNVSPQAISQQMRKRHISLSTWLAVEMIKEEKNVKGNIYAGRGDAFGRSVNAR